jgi:hypothetical protein
MQQNNQPSARNEQIMTVNFLMESENLDVYAEYLLANLCMPTLLKSKASSLLHLNKEKIKRMEYFLELIDRKIKRFESHSYLLYENQSMVILLIYNEELLREVLNNKENEPFLRTFGYEVSVWDIDSVLKRIKERYRQYRNDPIQITFEICGSRRAAFPHEIGIILGYPRQDVEDFIRYQGKNYVLCGYWKVYHERENALLIFENYRKMRNYALTMLMEGKTLQDIFEACMESTSENKQERYI